MRCSYPPYRATPIYLLLLAACQTRSPEQVPSKADSAALPTKANSSLPSADTDTLKLHHEFMELEQSAMAKRQQDYAPEIRDMLIKRGVPTATARRLALPLAKHLNLDQYDIADVLFWKRADHNGDQRDDWLFMLSNSPYDGSGRGLTTLALLSRPHGRFAGWATQPAWDRKQTEALPELDQVRISPRTGKPYFKRKAAQFPFIKFYR